MAAAISKNQPHALPSNFAAFSVYQKINHPLSQMSYVNANLWRIPLIDGNLKFGPGLGPFGWTDGACVGFSSGQERQRNPPNRDNPQVVGNICIKISQSNGKRSRRQTETDTPLLDFYRLTQLRFLPASSLLHDDGYKRSNRKTNDIYCGNQKGKRFLISTLMRLLLLVSLFDRDEISSGLI